MGIQIMSTITFENPLSTLSFNDYDDRYDLLDDLADRLVAFLLDLTAEPESIFDALYDCGWYFERESHPHSRMKDCFCGEGRFDGEEVVIRLYRNRILFYGIDGSRACLKHKDSSFEAIRPCWCLLNDIL